MPNLKVNLPSLDEMYERSGGVYWDKNQPLKNVERYTVYVYVEDEDVVVEEIDIDAISMKHALSIAKSVWSRDYQGKVKKMTVTGPRFGLYM